MASTSSYHLCVAWPRFSSLQLDYLEAVHNRIAREGASLIGLETARNDREHGKSLSRKPAPYQHEVLFKVRAYDMIPAPSMHRKTMLTLDRLQPDAVVVANFNAPDSRACLLWCKRNQHPAILLMDTQETSETLSMGRAWVRKRLLSLFDAVVVADPSQKALMEQEGIPDSCIHLRVPAVDETSHQTEHEARLAELEHAADTLWEAVTFGKTRSHRRQPISKTMLDTIQQLARTVHSFQPAPY